MSRLPPIAGYVRRSLQLTSVHVVNEEEARELARQELASEDFVITGTKRISGAWLVSYNNRKFVETGDIRYAEAGPGPLLVYDSGRIASGPGSTRVRRSPMSKTLHEWLVGGQLEQP